MAIGHRGFRTFALLAVAAALLLPALIPAAAEHQVPRPPERAGVSYEWWDPDGLGPLEWHFRLPIVVRPRLVDTLTPAPYASIEGARNFPAKIEVDFTAEVAAVGADGSTVAWPRDPLGRLSSLTFDPVSVRVLAYHPDTGRIQRDLGNGGVLAHSFFPGLLDNPGQRNAVFNATSNAVGTLFFVIPGAFRDQVTVLVYFDIAENGPKPAAEHSPEDQGILDGLHWIRTGTTFYGYLPGRAAGTTTPTVAVLALFENTTVQFSSYGRFPGLPPAPLPRCEVQREAALCTVGGELNLRTGSPLPTIGVTGPVSRQTISLRVNPGDEFFFRVEATKPIVAMVYTPGAEPRHITSAWFPATDGGLMGTEFRVLGLGNQFRCESGCEPPRDPNTLRLVAFQREATATVTDLTTSVSETFSVPAFGSVGLTGSVTYRVGGLYRITSTNPIGVASVAGTHPVGAPGINMYGGPGGTRLVAPISFKGFVGATTDTQAFLFNLDRNQERFPVEGTYPVKGSGSGASWRSERDLAPQRGEIWVAQSSGADIRFQAGMQGMFAWGGKDMGRDFLAITEFAPGQNTNYGIVVPLYDDTMVTIHDLARSDGRPVLQKTVSTDEMFWKRAASDVHPVISSRTSEAVETFRITASKPIAVYSVADPRGSSYGTVLPGKMAAPDYEVGKVAFYGCLVGWSPRDKGQSKTVQPGDRISFEFRAINLGTGVGGKSLRDNLSLSSRILSSAGAADGWRTTLSTTLLPGLATGESGAVSLAVDIPATAQSGDFLEVAVQVQSRCNPAMRDDASIRITVQTKYDFEMIFENGKKAVTEKILSEADGIRLNIRVRNLGSGNDSVTFTLAKTTAEQFGFRVQLVEPSTASTPQRPLVGEDGRGTTPLKLGVAEVRTIQLLIQPPPGGESAPDIPVTVEGTSGNDASVTDQVTATLRLNAETKILLEAEETSRPVAPGQDAVFNLTLTNLGPATEVELSRVVALRSAPGWAVNLSCERCKPVPGATEPLLAVSIGSGGSADNRVRFHLVVRAAANASVDTVLTAKVEARGGEGDAKSLSLTSRVTNSFALDIQDAPPPAVRPGDLVDLRLELLSRANGPLQAEIVPASLPSGWALAGRDPGGVFTVIPDSRREIGPRIKVRDNEAPGIYEVGVGLLLEDLATRQKVVKTVTVPFHVQRDLRLNLSIPTDLQAPPGGTVRVPVLVGNVGNEAATAGLRLDTPSGWTAQLVDALSPEVTLGPGESRYVNFSVKAPPALAGAAALAARAVIPPSGVPVEFEMALPVSIAPLRRDLRVESVTMVTQSRTVGSSAVFEVVVFNNGTRPAANVEVALVAGDEIASNFTIRSLPPGESRTFPLVWTVTQADRLSVVVDPRHLLNDDNRANNAFRIDLAEAPGGILGAVKNRVPAPAAWLALAAAALLVSARRRDP